MAAVDATGDSAWEVAFSRLDTGRSRHALLALSNGIVGVRGGIDELRDDSACFLADGYVRQPLTYHERFPGYADATDTRVAVGTATDLRILLDGALIDFAVAIAETFEQRLDLRTGVLDRRTRWRLADGRCIDVSARRIVPFGSDAVVASRLAVAPVDFDATVTLAFPITSANRTAEAVKDPRISAAGPAPVERASHADAEAATVVRSIGELTAACAQVLRGAAVTAEGGVQQVSAYCRAGHPVTADRCVGFAIDRDAPPEHLLALARGVAGRAAAVGFDALLNAQARVLARFWDNAGLTLDGDAALQRTLRFNLFHVFQSASRDDEHSIAAKGLTGEGYEGHYFWDADAFILPVLALTDAALARHMLAYRISRLARARQHAQSIGHARGALYPWRTIAGDECSAHYPTGSAQYHINAAVAYALEVYVAATGDTALLWSGGAEMLFETARIWLDIGHFSVRRGGAFVIHGVTGPDEYSALVDNDYYTNAMARRHLRFALAVAERLQTENAAVFEELTSRIDLNAAERATWARAADHMWLPVDAVAGVSPQDDSFLDKPHFDFAALPPDRFPLLLHYHPMVLFRHQLCKQGDVVQAMVMADDDATLSLKARNLDYYEPLTTHDSTLSASAFAILAAEVGAEDKALRYLRETAFVDLEDRHGNTSHGAHMAALAGSWLALTQGWGGLRIAGGELYFRPRCPAEWQGYSFRLCWQGSVIELSVDTRGATYRLVHGAPVRVIDQGRQVDVGPSPIHVPQPAIAAVIFDLDGVLTDTAAAHYRAWKRLCDEEGLPFDEHVNERLKGVDRTGSLRIILDHAGRRVDDDTFAAMMARKNAYYRASIAEYTPADLFGGAARLLNDCRRAGLKLALASASRNAAELVTRLGIEHAFDHIADAAVIENPKPAPDIFLVCAAAMGVDPAACVGVEDAAAGIAAIIAAGMRPIGIGDPKSLSKAAIVLPSIASLTFGHILVGDATVPRRSR